jgi:uncharacterized protein YyaL (SSP411 family)
MNRLGRETSPYLLQHAHNPVDWYPWGEEALQRARAEDKPILVSIGYSACHWCHVMERESFEDPSTAEIMNAHFINIKIDREERPDLDHIYMDAVQAMSGSGGWPLNVFLTPDAKPFYGGTYFPPVRAHNRVSWKEVLMGIRQNFEEYRAQVNEQARTVTEHLAKSNQFGLQPVQINIPFEEKFTSAQLDMAFEHVMGQADRLWGGFGMAPKFPQTFTIQFLLRYYHFTHHKTALEQALLSLDKMIQGGIYDHIGGGFARYSTDTEWLAPHFEKMLYDNALLVMVLCEANQITGNPIYAIVIRETLAFVERELMDENYGFYSALDADSEGVEGKFYVWTKKETEEVLGKDAGWFSQLYDITEEGNWEHTNIPRLKEWPADALSGINKDNIDICRRKMLEARGKRTRPMLDDKILLGWNALMNSAFSAAYAALGDDHYKEVAEKNMDFLFNTMVDHISGKAHHTYKNGVARFDAFLDDYAFLVRALTALQEITGETGYLDRAVTCTDYIIEGFSDEEGLFFYYTHQGQDDVILRKKEIYDGAIPSGNAVMAYNLHYLSVITDKSEWKERAVSLTDAVTQMAIRYPTSFGNWLNLIQEWVRGTWEIAIVGNNAENSGKEVLKEYIPCKVLQFSIAGNERFPLLAGKTAPKWTTLFLCRNYSCKNPVYNTGDFVQLIESELGSSRTKAQYPE